MNFRWPPRLITSALTRHRITFFGAVRYRVRRAPPHIALTVTMLGAFEQVARVALVRRPRAKLVSLRVGYMAVFGRRQERTAYA